MDVIARRTATVEHVEAATMMFITWIMAAALGMAGMQNPPAASQRFDYLVRADFFAGAAGDEARLAHVLEVCEKALEQNPNHPEAHVWHGAGLLVRAGRAFQQGDMAAGGPLFDRGLKEMNEALALAPDNPGVLIPRGAVLFEATRNMSPEMARPLVQSAVQNYERALEIQAPTFAALGDHAKGELLFGLAEGWSRLGETDKAGRYFERVIADAPSSGQTPKARTWIATGSIPKSTGPQCIGCHK
jgi:tetratricopeptide (TPR) repeat protein